MAINKHYFSRKYFCPYVKFLVSMNMHEFKNIDESYL